MNENPPIVVGIDFSPASPNALRHAAKIAKVEGAPLVAVHVIDSSRISHWLTGRPGDTELANLEEEAKQKLANLVATEPNAGGAELIVASGRPSEEMQKVIDEKSAGLLIIAANDTTKNRLGLTASRCVRTAHCDVLILRDWQDNNFSKIMACIDLTGRSKEVIARGLQAAEQYNASLSIVHVMYPPDKDIWGGAVEQLPSSENFAEHSRATARTSMEKALSPFTDRLQGLKVETRILEAMDPAPRLTDFTDETKADLVILGTTGHSKLGAYFLGTNAERLLHDAPLSVLAVRV